MAWSVVGRLETQWESSVDNKLVEFATLRASDHGNSGYELSVGL